VQLVEVRGRAFEALVLLQAAYELRARIVFIVRGVAVRTRKQHP
jgi:hypothetical protein